MKKHLCAVACLLVTASLANIAADDQATPQTGQLRTAKAPNPTLPSRVFVDVNGGYRIGTLTFAESRTDTYFAETASWTADYEVKGAPVFDAGGGVRVWRNFLAGVSYSQYRDTNAASIVGAIPHPFFFNQNRSISGESEALKHQERSLNVNAIWSIPLASSLEVAVFGGPSFIAVKRSFVKDIAIDDVYPFETASFNHATVEEVKRNEIGIQGGADVTWLFSQHVGLGATVRFTRASARFATPAGGTTSVDLGGLETIAGLRIRLGGRGAPKSRVEPQAPPRQATPSIRRVRPEPESAPPSEPSDPVVAEKTPPSASSDRLVAIAKGRLPVYVRPEVLQSPLVVLGAGTRLTVLDDFGEWLRVEFNDRQWGRRVGYVERRLVAVDQP